ncbi:hypothetical protein T02_4843 [Trichinella nativa]|uniref:Uncharacterized protein n=1 Tax=Trichinella nativa TaxID=6335 RepID=A0A0V1KZ26_9BILA|nr:hypothetical protein T02_4843 [Trichinella nativa]
MPVGKNNIFSAGEDSNARFVPDPAEEEVKPPFVVIKYSTLLSCYSFCCAGCCRISVSIVKRPTQAPITVGLALKRNETRQLPLMGHQTAKNRTTVNRSKGQRLCHTAVTTPMVSYP